MTNSANVGEPAADDAPTPCMMHKTVGECRQAESCASDGIEASSATECPHGIYRNVRCPECVIERLTAERDAAEQSRASWLWAHNAMEAERDAALRERDDKPASFKDDAEHYLAEREEVRQRLHTQFEHTARALRARNEMEAERDAALRRAEDMAAALLDIVSDCGVMAERHPGGAEDDFHAIWQKADAALEKLGRRGPQPAPTEEK